MGDIPEIPQSIGVCMHKKTKLSSVLIVLGICTGLFHKNKPRPLLTNLVQLLMACLIKQTEACCLLLPTNVYVDFAVHLPYVVFGRPGDYQLCNSFSRSSNVLPL